MKTKVLGITFAILSAVVFGVMPLLTKLLYQMGCNAISVPFYRYLIIAIAFALYMHYKGVSFKLQKSAPWQVMVTAFFGVYVTVVFLFKSYYLIPSGVATTVHFLYPVIVSIGGVIVSKRVGHPLKYLALALSIIGIFLLFEISGDVNWLGIVLCLIAAGGFAAYILFIEYSNLKYENSLVLAFYFNVLGVLFFGVHGLITGELAFNYPLRAWGLLLIFAFLVGVGGSLAFQIAIGYIGGQSASILSTVEPITSIVLGALVLDEAMNYKMAIGMALIIIAALIVIVLQGYDDVPKGG